MTDHLKGFVVTLDDNIREDDAQFIADAIRMIKRVKTVDPVPSEYGISDWLTKTDAVRDIEQKIMNVFQAERGMWS